MNYEKMTIKLQEALQESNSIARQKDHSEIGNEHILKALLEQKDGLVPPLVECVGIPSEKLISQIDSLLSQYPVVRGNTQMALSPSAQKVLAKAENEMSSLKDQFLSVEHILLAMAQSDDRVGETLRRVGCTRNALLEALKKVRGNQSVDSQDPESKMRRRLRIPVEFYSRTRRHKGCQDRQLDAEKRRTAKGQFKQNFCLYSVAFACAWAIFPYSIKTPSKHTAIPTGLYREAALPIIPPIKAAVSTARIT